MKNNNSIPLSEYPNPQFVRDSYYSLNGLWDYHINDQKNKKIYEGQILVPYCLESSASTVKKTLKKNHTLVYHKSFKLDPSFLKEKTLLHFLGVDQEFYIKLNGTTFPAIAPLGLPSAIDISKCVSIHNELEVYVKDNLSFKYPYGKQSKHPKGIFYTPVSGIYYPVYLESLPLKHISAFKLTPTMNSLKFSVETTSDKLQVLIYENGKLIKEKDCSKSHQGEFTFATPHLWSIEDPFLYDLVFKTENEEVKTYFALRSIAMKNGMCYLNKKKIRLKGILDQGYFLDGIYTPNTYNDYQKDLQIIKELGFNTVRKHIKIELPYFYYLCDKLGLLLIQDFVNNGKYHFLRDTALPTIGLRNKNDRFSNSNKEARNNFILHSEKTIDYLYNHPSLIGYTIFNEGWGQFNADKNYRRLKALDPTRLFDATSGWFNRHLSDFKSFHLYFKNIDKLAKLQEQPIFLSEFGGYSYKVPNHSVNQKEFGYKKYTTQVAYQEGVISLFKEKILPYRSKLCGFVYTQFSDVETEENGLVTADRKFVKVDSKEFKKLLDTF